MRSCLRLSTYILKTKHEFKFAALNMSSQKRNSDGLNNCIPSKLRRGQSKNTHFNREKSTFNTSVLNNIEMSSVEVMETPDKPDYDKKSYRVIRLENGLKALLISDPTQERPSNVEQPCNADKHEVTSTSDEEEDGHDEDDEETGSEQSDDDENNGSKNEKRGKLAACSLCVDVGSFSDPRDVQGLAHFLGNNINICQMFKYRIY